MPIGWELLRRISEPEKGLGAGEGTERFLEEVGPGLGFKGWRGVGMVVRKEEMFYG